MISLFEFEFVLAILILAITVPTLGQPLFRHGSRLFRAVACRRWLAIGGVAALTLVIEVCVGLLIHMPQPAIHDEFAYLLTADTFAHGRLTNATHPLREHFEAPHVLQQPTYQAKYPPGQGAVLALGQVLFGAPIVGVWISVAAACAATCWMLYGWMPPRWALLGGLLTALHPGILIEWGQGYWGGAVAMLGGALVYGALPRIMRDQGARHAVLLGLGLGILANSRPYEGLVACLPAFVVLLVWWFKKREGSLAFSFSRVVLPVVAVLGITFAWMGYYNYRVTGHPWQMPYQVWLEQTNIGVKRLFWGLPKNLSTSILEKQPTAAKATSAEARQPTNHDNAALQLRHPGVKLLKYYMFYCRLALGIPLLAILWILRKKSSRLAVVTCLMVLASIIAQSTAPHAHYAAPAICLLMVIVVEGLRHLRQWEWRGKPSGRFMARTLPIAFAASSAVFIATTWRHQPYPVGHSWSLVRAAVRSKLEQRPGQHLVIVRYSPDHIWHHEWVYNGADLDGSQVVWARELEPVKNRRLLEYFEDRTVWLLEPDADPPRLARVRHGSRAASDAVARQQRSPTTVENRP